jgi:uncharacterized protein (TIGR02996 family)
MTDEEAFLEAILAGPDNDVPRLIFADWLEEHGDPRAEFIRVQCQLARLPDDDPRCAELAAREQLLLRAYQGEWVGPVAGWSRSLKFRRGFLDELTVNLETFLYRAEQLVALAPAARVDLMELGQWVGQEAANRFAIASRLRKLALRPELSRVTGLHLSYSALTADCIHALLASPHLGRLRTLDLRHNALGDDGAVILAACPALADLATLNLTSNLIGSGGFQALVSSPYLAELRSLELAANSIDDRGLFALLESSHLPRLATLVLKRNAVTDHGAEALASWPGLAHMRTVDLSDNFIGDAGARALRQAPAGPVDLWIGLGGNHCSRPEFALRLPAPSP